MCLLILHWLNRQTFNPMLTQFLQPPAPAPPKYGVRYVALFDYTAADDDEVSFNEGISLMDT